jgi:transcriptional regulator with XRE-family HTH domain
MEFKDRLKELRTENGLIRADMSDLFGCSEATVRSWENGKKQPDFGTAILMAISFDCTLDYLAGLSDSREPSPAVTTEGL